MSVKYRTKLMMRHNLSFYRSLTLIMTCGSIVFVTKTDWQPIYNVHMPLTHTDTKFVFSSGDFQGLASRLTGTEGRLTVS